MKTILFVDDEPAILRGLSFALRKDRVRWHQVFAAGGLAALRELETTPFDLIVTDLQMPEMDGVALLERMRIAHPAVACIVLTGNAEQSAIDRARTLAHVVLSKPIPAEALRASIARVLNEA